MERTCSVILLLALCCNTDAFIYPHGSKRLYVVDDTANDEHSEFMGMPLPVPIVFHSGWSQLNHIPIPDIIQNVGDKTDFENIPMKRALDNLPMMDKRIHTCAFMRRLGLPIGLCFKGARSRASQQQRVHEAQDNRQEDAYAYLARQWPVNSILGGGVGR